MEKIEDCSVYFEGGLSPDISAVCLDLPADSLSVIHAETFCSFSTFINRNYQDHILLLCENKQGCPSDNTTPKKNPFYVNHEQGICFFESAVSEIENILSQICINSFASFGLLCLRKDIRILEEIASLYAQRDFTSMINYCCKHRYSVIIVNNGYDGFSLSLFQKK